MLYNSYYTLSDIYQWLYINQYITSVINAMKLFSWFFENMILDFDSAEAPEVYILQYIIVSSCPAVVCILLSCPAVRRSWARPPGGRLLIFYTFYATYTTYNLIFCAIIQIKNFFEKSIDICEKVWYNIVTAREKTKMILEK